MSIIDPGQPKQITYKCSNCSHLLVLSDALLDFGFPDPSTAVYDPLVTEVVLSCPFCKSKTSIQPAHGETI